MVERADVFVEQLAIHSMLAAGTPGVQGVAPKFLLTQDEEGRWFPDTALPDARARRHWIVKLPRGRHGTDFRSEEHTSELQSLMRISYAVFCLKKKKKTDMYNNATGHRQHTSH